jgi:excisionase family DNA binding protein
MKTEKLTYNVPEAAKALGISVPKLYQLCKTKDFPACRLGARIVIPIDRLEHWLNDQAGKIKE